MRWKNIERSITHVAHVTITHVAHVTITHVAHVIDSHVGHVTITHVAHVTDSCPAIIAMARGAARLRLALSDGATLRLQRRRKRRHQRIHHTTFSLQT